ncbi:hypothetical protein SAMN02745133_02786 [Desulforamulus putei DSM 12395]|uniref:Uncharacterized protein n=1 Tax=Desulforamulus putei DSM 12395 TaxID=1121429 RepID=A0A1M5C308_9FIRM|nr:hypothetical protein SAMN02745133_02786 [Desulforamulus putei DSM 12395]
MIFMLTPTCPRHMKDRGTAPIIYLQPALRKGCLSDYDGNPL